MKYYLHAYTYYSKMDMKYNHCNDVSTLEAGDFMIYLKTYEGEQYAWINTVEITEEQYKKLHGRF